MQQRMGLMRLFRLDLGDPALAQAIMVIGEGE